MDLVSKPVQLHSLVGRPELNGRIGRAVSYDAEKGRVGVQLDGEKKPIAIKPANLNIAPEADSRSCTLVAMLATHISSQARLFNFGQCIKSIAQSSRLPQIVAVSFSAATEELGKLTAQVIKQLEASLEGEAVVLSKMHAEPRSQFEHFHCLEQELEELGARFPGPGQMGESIASSWVIFSDDDDLWHPHRSAVYAQQIDEVGADPEVRAIVCPWYATPTPGVAGKPSAQRRPRWDEVDMFLEREKAMVHTSTPPTAGSAEEHVDEEYWMYAVRYGSLQRFFAQATGGLLASPFCDVAFRAFVRRIGGSRGWTVYLEYRRGFPWMYYYDNEETGGASPPSTGQWQSPLAAAVAAASTSQRSEPDGASRHASRASFVPVYADEAAAMVTLPRLKARFRSGGFSVDKGFGCEADLARVFACLRRHAELHLAASYNHLLKLLPRATPPAASEAPDVSDDDERSRDLSELTVTQLRTRAYAVGLDKAVVDAVARSDEPHEMLSELLRAHTTATQPPPSATAPASATARSKEGEEGEEAETATAHADPTAAVGDRLAIFFERTAPIETPGTHDDTTALVFFFLAASNPLAPILEAFGVAHDAATAAAAHFQAKCEETARAAYRRSSFADAKPRLEAQEPVDVADRPASAGARAAQGSADGFEPSEWELVDRAAAISSGP